MLRKARMDAFGALHHIIVLIIKRGRIFSGDQDRDDFIERLCNIVIEMKTSCFAWVLIPNYEFYGGYMHRTRHLRPAS
jgi:hypothetical protein